MPLDDTNFPTITEDDETTALLIRARGLLARGWCQHSLARDAYGRNLRYPNKSAVEWCAVGAILAASVNPNDRRKALRRLEVAIGRENVVEFNNRQETVEPVLAAFDRAIASV